MRPSILGASIVFLARSKMFCVLYVLGSCTFVIFPVVFFDDSIVDSVSTMWMFPAFTAILMGAFHVWGRTRPDPIRFPPV